MFGRATTFKELYIKEDGIVHRACGQLNAKNRMGAYVGWTYFYTQKYKSSSGSSDNNWSMLLLSVQGEVDIGVKEFCQDSPVLRY
jgi:hypothetical protein